MHDDVSDQIYALVAEERGIDRSKLTSRSTLSYDLGMEGDDAVEFFERFQIEFKVDLSGLYENWPCYFAPEAVSPLMVAIVIFPGALVGFGLGQLLPSVPAWLCFILGMLLCLVPFSYIVRVRSQKLPQITLQDLVDCAQQGRWSKLPPRVDRNGKRDVFSQ